MPIVGSFAGASSRAYGLQAGVLVGDFESISTFTLTGSQSNVEFTSIPSTYSHLQIRIMARSTAADTDNNIYFQFNADTATNYSDHAVYGTGASAASYGNTNNNIPAMFRITAGNSTASIFGVGVADILDYANTSKFKTIKSISGHDQNGSGFIFLFSANWRNTNAITSIKLFPAVGSFAQYSSFALYGVKA